MDPEIDEEDKRCGLEMAFSYALNADQMNRFMLELLKVCDYSPEQLPIDEKSRMRRLFGRVIGNAFFFSDVSCPHFKEEDLPLGSCCIAHQMEGWRRVIRDLPLIPFPDELKETFVTLQVALRAAIISNSNVTFDEWKLLVHQIFATDDDS